MYPITDYRGSWKSVMLRSFGTYIHMQYIIISYALKSIANIICATHIVQTP